MRIAMIMASIAALMTSGAASADDWRPLTAQRDGTNVRILPKSLHRDGDVISAVLRFTPRDQPEWASLVSVNCLRHTVFSARLPTPSEGNTAIRPAAGAFLVSATSGWASRVRRHGLGILLSASVWGLAIVGFGLCI